jgi:hypothetical protein
MSTNTLAIQVQQPSTGQFGDGDFTGSSRPENVPGTIIGFGKSIKFWAVAGITFRTEFRPGQRAVSAEINRRLVYINGMNSSRENHAYSAKLISVISGLTVVGIYNQSGQGTNETKDPKGDIFESIGLYTGDSNNPCTKTVTQAVIDACTSGVQLNTISTSQGSIVVSAALTLAKAKLIKRYIELDPEGSAELARQRAFVNGDARERIRQIRGTQDRQNAGKTLPQIIDRKIRPFVDRRLQQFVSVHTFGGAIRTYPSGPRYRHVINSWDPFPTGGGLNISPRLGVSSTDDFTQTINRNAGGPGKDFADDHDFDNLYIQSSDTFVDRLGRRVDNSYLPLDMSIIR